MSKEEMFLMKPKVDFCFKELMEDAEIRRGFISALLDVEIQLAAFPLWPERSVFYLAKMYTGAIQKGQSYDMLPKCIHVGILDFVLFEEDEEFYSCFHFWEDTRRRMYMDKLEIHILELPKLEGYEYPRTELLKWGSFLRAEKKEEFEMAAEGSSYIERAYERLTEISADDSKRLEYEAREKAIRDHTYLMNYNLQKGLEEGRKEGMEQGIKALVKFCREYACTREETCSRLIQNFSISLEEAEEYLEKYWPAEV